MLRSSSMPADNPIQNIAALGIHPANTRPGEANRYIRFAAPASENPDSSAFARPRAGHETGSDGACIAPFVWLCSHLHVQQSVF